MLLGHWLEMRSVRQASGALDELAKLMPDTAESIRADGSTRKSASTNCSPATIWYSVRPGASVPADGEIVQGESYAERGDDHRRIQTGRAKARAMR